MLQRSSMQFGRRCLCLSRKNPQYRAFSSSTLIVGEHSDGQLSDCTKSCIAAAKQISDNTINILVAGVDCEGVAAEASKMDGIARVLYCDHEMFKSSALVENYSNLMTEMQTEYEFTHILAGVSSFARDCMPRTAGILNAPQISDVISVIDDNTFQRPIYAGNAICDVSFTDPSATPKLLTTRMTAFPFDDDSTDSQSQSNTADIVKVECKAANFDGKTFIADEISKSAGPSLTSASIVVSGGRGMKNGDNFQMLHEMCDLLGDAAVGASRAAVDAGYVSNDLQVGQTGKNVAPSLYMAVGISGAIQHVAGMKDSKVIVAINNDPEAPIFSIADYGLCQDLFTAVPELNQLLQESKGK